MKRSGRRAREAIRYWDELIAPTFEEVNGTGGADIVYANTSTGPDQAWAYYPNGKGTPYFKHIASDVWIATPRSIPRMANWGRLLRLNTLVHETVTAWA
jgi:serralysin